MYIKEQYIMHHLANQLVHNDGYEVLHINELTDEIWLEKYMNRITHVIRLKHQKFDWKNELKADISKTFQKTVAMEELFIGKKININNIYIATHEPVDDWELLKKPLQYKRRKQMNMHVYYLAEQDLEAELVRLSHAIGTAIHLKNIEDDPVVLEEKVHAYHHQLQTALRTTKKEAQSVLSFGKPLFTYILLIANIIFFLIVEFNGGSTETTNLIRFGAKYNPAIIDGEWWRIGSSMFLHIGLLHLMMNMLALYYLGMAVERIFGSVRFLFIYTFAGIGGGVASFALTMNVSAGASGAIFGLFGALLFFGLYQRRLFLQTMGRGILFLIGFNVIFGFIISGIDNSAHLGGLFAGFIASAIVHLPRMRELSKQALAIGIYCVLITALVVYGVQSGTNNAMYHLDQTDYLLQEQRYEEMVLHASEGLQKNSTKELEANLYFQRSIAHINLNQYDLAILDLEESIILQPDFYESHQNLAAIHAQLGNSDQAEEAIQNAYDLNPDDEKIIQLYEEIIGKPPSNT